ncbi:hypothetical protein QBC34DRAFT_84837 [Podospora aff. communis PSN243]|uniref:Uncharacterized protein n=1 Tax=Podospora aff. communis PSN243 TaxID=3040156 RepID=A0AAV9GPN9_9PEZI|nr:hypothetical protein QBC34DRAFT_84837 [Podospora aff. communis PSN243]
MPHQPSTLVVQSTAHILLPVPTRSLGQASSCPPPSDLSHLPQVDSAVGQAGTSRSLADFVMGMAPGKSRASSGPRDSYGTKSLCCRRTCLVQIRLRYGRWPRTSCLLSTMGRPHRPVELASDWWPWWLAGRIYSKETGTCTNDIPANRPSNPFRRSSVHGPNIRRALRNTRISQALLLWAGRCCVFLLVVFLASNPTPSGGHGLFETPGQDMKDARVPDNAIGCKMDLHW